MQEGVRVRAHHNFGEETQLEVQADHDNPTAALGHIALCQKWVHVCNRRIPACEEELENILCSLLEREREVAWLLA